MPEFRELLDVYQGYDFKEDKQTTVGFITQLALNGTALNADQSCKNPTNPTDTIRAVAVLSDILWETGVTDAVYFSGQVSVTTKQAIMTLIYNALVNVSVDLAFEVYEHDPNAKVYYACFSSKTAVKGLIEKKGDELNLTVAEDPSIKVQSPLNYAFQTGIKPYPLAQTLQIAKGNELTLDKAWGLKLGR